MIEVKNLTKFYNENKALSDISFSIQKGEIVGFLGPNGAGKTTTMKILTCFISASSGEAKIAGLDVFEKPDEVRRKIGYLPESNPLYTEMNVYEYLGFIADMHDIAKTKRDDKIKKTIEICGLAPKIRSEISELSKGYKQRVGLAQALIHDPDILILDEPTTGLDPNQIVEIRSLIKQIGKEKTILLSTHILPEVEATCDRVIIINKGEIVASGTPQELKGQGEGQPKIVLHIEGSEDQSINVLKSISGVTLAKKLKNIGRNINEFEVETEKGLDLRKEINHTLIKNNLELLEMRRDAMSLENIFAKLTKK